MPLFRRRRRAREPEPPVPDELPTRPRAVFDALARHHVDYVTIGGVAVQSYGHVRTTQDVGIVVGPEPANLRRLADALRELRAHLRGVDAHVLGIDPTEPRTLAEGANFTLATLAGPVDVWTGTAELRGSPARSELRARAEVVRLPDAALDVVVAGREDLIALKRAAAEARAAEGKRRIDLEDVAFLADPGRRPGSGDTPPPAPER
jgi:hypothetical protein